MTPVGQTANGKWELGVRRTFELEHDEAWLVLTSSTGLGTLLGGGATVLDAGRTFTDSDNALCEVRSVTTNEVARISWRLPEWETASTLQLRVIPAASGTTIAIHHEGLPDQSVRHRLLRRWTTALELLRSGLPASDGPVNG